MSQGPYPVCFLLPTFQGLLVLVLYIRPRGFSCLQWGNGESTSAHFQSQICGHGNFRPVFVLPRRSREGELPSHMNLFGRALIPCWHPEKQKEIKQNTSAVPGFACVCSSVIEGIRWHSHDLDHSQFGYLFVNQCTRVSWAPSNSHCFLPVVVGLWPISLLTWLGAHRGRVGKCPFYGLKASIELKGQLSHPLIQPPWFSY